LQGEWLRVAGRFDEAIAESERAVALDPSDSLALANLSNILSSAGRAPDGLDAIKSALRIDPHYPPLYLHYLAKAQFGLGHFAEAAASWEEETKRSPEASWGFVFLASAYGHLGRASEAKAAIAKADAGFASSRTTVLLGAVISYKDRSDLERFLDGLRKAGVPELPFGYDERTADRLSGDAIRLLLFGHTMRGRDADGAAFTVKRTADGGVTKNDPAGSETGRSVIEGDRLCSLYPLSGRSCVAVFRNPRGTSARQDQYIIVSPWGETMFSVTE
jgi:tetratricopeptide (TPR) repeat protein